MKPSPLTDTMYIPFNRFEMSIALFATIPDAILIPLIDITSYTMCWFSLVSIFIISIVGLGEKDISSSVKTLMFDRSISLNVIEPITPVSQEVPPFQLAAIPAANTVTSPVPASGDVHKAENSSKLLGPLCSR